jgi:hypothetical protein
MDDVKDDGALKAYLEKRSEWFSLYDSNKDEPNAIQNQIQLMLLSEMSYRVLLEERQYAKDYDPINLPILTHLLYSGYFSSQILAVRRLFDPARRDDVISLPRILNDMKRHQHLITREIFVSFDGTPYEPSVPDLGVPGLQARDSPFSNYVRSSQRHERFDGLSKRSARCRNRFDRIHEDIFKKLDTWLDGSGAQRLITYSHKYLAHAADKPSRKKVVPASLSFSEVEIVQEAAVKVSGAIFDVILNSGICSKVVPMTPLGFFGRVWDGTLMVEATSRMQKYWDDMAAIRDAWPDNLEDELCA